MGFFTGFLENPINLLINPPSIALRARDLAI
jgi:hypothetical protein